MSLTFQVPIFFRYATAGMGLYSLVVYNCRLIVFKIKSERTFADIEEIMATFLSFPLS
jgi:hypothetical protein